MVSLGIPCYNFSHRGRQRHASNHYGSDTHFNRPRPHGQHSGAAPRTRASWHTPGSDLTIFMGFAQNINRKAAATCTVSRRLLFWWYPWGYPYFSNSGARTLRSRDGEYIFSLQLGHSMKPCLPKSPSSHTEEPVAGLLMLFSQWAQDTVQASHFRALAVGILIRSPRRQ